MDLGHQCLRGEQDGATGRKAVLRVVGELVLDAHMRALEQETTRVQIIFGGATGAIGKPRTHLFPRQ